MNKIFSYKKFKYKPTEWNFIRKYKRLLKKLRKIAREQIEQRLLMIKEDSYIPKDILSNLLKSHGKLKSLNFHF